MLTKLMYALFKHFRCTCVGRLVTRPPGNGVNSKQKRVGSASGGKSGRRIRRLEKFRQNPTY